MSSRQKLPPYLVWRAGRPRWEPGPGLRAIGHKGRDLKRDGRWMSKGEAVDEAEAINAAIGAGKPAPKAEPGVATMAALFEHVRALPRFQPTDVEALRKLKLSPRTVKEYLRHLRILEAWCGDMPAADLSAQDIEFFYHAMVEGRGLSMANALMRTLKIALNVATRSPLRWMARNEASDVRMIAADGRLMLWEVDEVIAAIACADWLGMEAIGDAIALGVLTGQRKADVLAVPPMTLVNGAYRFQTRKTGAVAYVPETKPLKARLDAMRTRKAARWAGVVFGTEIVDEAGHAYENVYASKFGEAFRLVMFYASGEAFALEDLFRNLDGLPPLLRNAPFKPQPSLSLEAKRFQDLRDTAVTWLFEATGGDKTRIATITGHSLKTIDTILDKHYFVRHERQAIAAGVQLDALFEKTGMRL